MTNVSLIENGIPETKQDKTNDWEGEGEWKKIIYSDLLSTTATTANIWIENYDR